MSSASRNTTASNNTWAVTTADGAGQTDATSISDSSYPAGWTEAQVANGQTASIAQEAAMMAAERTGGQTSPKDPDGKGHPRGQESLKDEEGGPRQVSQDGWTEGQNTCPPQEILLRGLESEEDLNMKCQPHQSLASASATKKKGQTSKIPWPKQATQHQPHTNVEPR